MFKPDETVSKVSAVLNKSLLVVFIYDHLRTTR
jgi:hypothetical protein